MSCENSWLKASHSMVELCYVLYSTCVVHWPNNGVPYLATKLGTLQHILSTMDLVVSTSSTNYIFC
jgi:hypothetical protein